MDTSIRTPYMMNQNEIEMNKILENDIRNKTLYEKTSCNKVYIPTYRKK